MIYRNGNQREGMFIHKNCSNECSILLNDMCFPSHLYVFYCLYIVYYCCCDNVNEKKKIIDEKFDVIIRLNVSKLVASISLNETI